MAKDELEFGGNGFRIKFNAEARRSEATSYDFSESTNWRA